MNKINQDEIPDIISAEIPEIKREISELSRENLAGALQVVVSYIRDRITVHEIAKVIYSISLVGWIYNCGNERVKDLIENLFVRSFNGMRKLCSQYEWGLIEKRIPIKLLTVYTKQQY
ncbi:MULTISPECIES: DUF7674 family protein [Olivibacter]|jgi:hypothetical protein|uniref:DUF7674 domain-containing protein n=2 Tax=Sphingobacteriaceae TaxID=84566 RepID=F4C4K5_SPHS2|nr:hypothetical protein [Olivibacter sp. 47]MCL4639006.1 hypothetical protein [Olivibacter sp. UJ_SKK_5.1]MDM8172899.1 hypothetical protein [Olivibacter sp. 47]MDX3915635.1 hypothetical protein [Pseudosphingobacterium sp.]